MLNIPVLALHASAAIVAPAPGPAGELLSGVKAITQVGTAGEVAIWGPEAFAVVLGGTGRVRVPIVAAGPLGKGRVMAWSHSFCSAGAAARLDTGVLLVNAARWLGGGKKVGLLDSDLEAWLKGQGIDAATLKGGAALAEELKDCGALLCGKADLSDRETDAILQFVRAGGGVACFTCPWGWAQVRNKPVAEAPLNTILAPAGIAFAGGYAETTAKGGFAAEDAPGPEFNAAKALELLEKGEKLDKQLAAQAAASAVLAARSLPRSDTLWRPRLTKLLAGRKDALAPSEKTPLKAEQALDRVLLSVQLDEAMKAPADSVQPHPAAKNFPGEVPADAPRTPVTVEIKSADHGGKSGWISTGAYAPPGASITASRIGAEKGLRVRIGCHKDDLWSLAVWKRAPSIDRSWPLDAKSVTIANAFGGPIYIEVPDGFKAGETITISGAVEAPVFTLGAMSDEQWAKERGKPGPWAELVCDRVVLSVPTSIARRIDRPTAVMEHWVRVLDATADLAGRSRERRRPERYVADIQISAGYMHSGYPIMTHLDAADFMTDLKGLTEHGWGPYHEMGHNHQDGMWTFEGTGEVTCNLFTLYVLETVCGVEHPENGRVLNEDGARKRARYLSEGAKFEKWKSDPFLALQMYAMVKRDFGWEPFKKAFAQYRDLPRGERPKTDDEKRDQWLVRLSRAVGRDLGPFFVAWGVPTSEGARASLSGLPEWMPEELKAR